MQWILDTCYFLLSRLPIVMESMLLSYLGFSFSTFSDLSPASIYAIQFSVRSALCTPTPTNHVRVLGGVRGLRHRVLRHPAHARHVGEVEHGHGLHRHRHGPRPRVRPPLKLARPPQRVQAGLLHLAGVLCADLQFRSTKTISSQLWSVLPLIAFNYLKNTFIESFERKRASNFRDSFRGRYTVCTVITLFQGC